MCLLQKIADAGKFSTLTELCIESNTCGNQSAYRLIAFVFMYVCTGGGDKSCPTDGFLFFSYFFFVPFLVLRFFKTKKEKKKKSREQIKNGVMMFFCACYSNSNGFFVI